MAKTFETFRKDVQEWSAPTAHTAHVTDRISVQTNKSAKAKRPNVKQLVKMPFTTKERKWKGIHGFTLNDPYTI